MINENILRLLKTHCDTSPYFINIIKDYDQKTECNQETLILCIQQVNLNEDNVAKLKEILEESIITERNLSVISSISADEDNLYTGKLTGYISKQKSVEDDIDNSEDVLNKYIEILDTKLKKKIEIEFEKVYEEQPKVILNIDKEYESYYKNYSTTFIQNSDGYIGVEITFNSLKTKNKYPIISIIIIGGEEKEEEESE